MTVIDLKTMREVSKPPVSVVCLGNFDGVHIGHAALIDEAKRQVSRLSQDGTPVACGVCFFRKPPSSYLLSSPIPQLMTFEQKLGVFRDMGLDVAFVMDFAEIGGLAPEQFVSEILVKKTGCMHAVCGFNFRFGSKAAGTADQLKKLMRGAVSVIDPVQREGQTVCSSSIRQLILDGDLQAAIPLLGRPYCIEAEVLHGKALGRTMGVPTINQHFAETLAVPKCGIYVTQTEVDGISYPSVTNVGVRPSVENGALVNCETHILNADLDLYGKIVKVAFIKRLRDEMKFDSIDQLKEQIQKDIDASVSYFKEAAV